MVVVIFQVVPGIDDAINSGITNLAVLSHTTSNTPNNGVGLGISMGIEDAGGLVEAGAMDFVLTDAADASVAQFEVKTANGGGGATVTALSATAVKTHITGVTESSSATTGSLIVAGGMSLGKQLYSGSTMRCGSTSEPTSSTAAGSLHVVGGAGIAKRLYSGSITVAEGTTAATSSITGSMVSAGGAGVAKSVYTGGQLVSHVVDTITNAVSDLLVLKHASSGTPAAGLGVGIDISIEDAGDTGSVGALDFSLATVTGDSESAQAKLTLITGGTANTDVMTISGATTAVDVPTASTSASSGSLQVTGGVGIALAMYSGGQLVADVSFCCCCCCCCRRWCRRWICPYSNHLTYFPLLSSCTRFLSLLLCIDYRCRDCGK